MRAAIFALALAACAADSDPELATCATPDITLNGSHDGLPPEFCSSQCAAVTTAEASAGPSCHSSAFAAAYSGDDTCQSVTTADGESGCCVIGNHSVDARVPSGAVGFVFYPCD